MRKLPGPKILLTIVGFLIAGVACSSGGGNQGETTPPPSPTVIVSLSPTPEPTSAPIRTLRLGESSTVGDFTVTADRCVITEVINITEQSQQQPKQRRASAPDSLFILVRLDAAYTGTEPKLIDDVLLVAGAVLSIELPAGTLEKGPHGRDQLLLGRQQITDYPALYSQGPSLQFEPGQTFQGWEIWEVPKEALEGTQSVQIVSALYPLSEGFGATYALADMCESR